ncbi:MAG: O-acetylhomoserine aminocarboxypropyltransferase/cysteine synthase [Kiritimatiellae bacterium]|nr:O-acetylhomoserine aminocarboxypropyltransferase/cysteine synthase [Kiritimatiellia bacterium]
MSDSSKTTANYDIGTLCVQGGWQPRNGESRQLPIIQSTTWKYASSDAMGALFDLQAEGYFYTRLQNPTNDSVASKIVALEGGAAGLLTSSGQAANFFAIFNLAGCGDHVVSSSALYGGTLNLFTVTMKRMGIDFTLVSPDADDATLDAAFRPNTKALFGETLSNPSLDVLDLERWAAAAHRHGVPLVLDNTFPTPVNCRPIEWGCDIVTHSTTKYMDGHAAQVGGAIVDSGNFDWLAHAYKFPGLCAPDESYHGIVYAERFGKAAFVTKCVAQLMRDFGSIPSPFNSFLLNLGLESLHVRVPRHCANARAVAEWLRDRPETDWIHYPDLPGDPQHEKARKYLPHGSSGVIAFGLKGDRARAIRFMDALKFVSIATHVADARSCILHPASHTHRQLTEEQLAAAGIPVNLIRLSVGIEDPGDIIADLEQALRA